MRHHLPWTRASRIDPVPTVKTVAVEKLRISVALVLVSLSFGTSGGRGDVVPPPIAVDAPTVAWAGQVAWGISRFQAARLDLPSPLSVEVHDDTAACHGHSGRFQPGQTPVVHLCATAEPGSRVARLITLHELAHAWAETQLGPAERDAFLTERHLDVWIDGDVEPHRWGAEHAAEVMSWGLMDEPVRIIRVDHAEPAQLLVAFRSLAHQAPLWQSAESAGVVLSSALTTFHSSPVIGG